MTFQEIINGALRSLGVIASGESPATEESADALTALNDMIASWSAIGLPIYFVSKDTVALTGAASYTLPTRPTRIKSAAVLATNGTNMSVPVVAAEDWAGVPDKTRTGIFAEALYCDFAYPTPSVYLTPKPTTGTLELYCYHPLPSTNALTDTVTLPPGYQRALRFNLAVDLAGEYGRTASPELLSAAGESKAAITGLNALVLGEQTPAAPAQPAPMPQAA
jgi:hypothetical protein